MASSFIHPPDDYFGPCVEPCTHMDCATYRRIAKLPCDFCGEEIGFNRPYYADMDTFAHASCFEENL